MSSKYITIRLFVENTPLFQPSIDDLLLITITITSNSFNKDINNSIEGYIPLFSAKQKTSNNNLNDFAASYGPFYDQALTN